jgi:hypothetical protein
MTDNMKKHFALAAALLVAAGCSSFRTNVYEDNLSLPLSEARQTASSIPSRWNM